jgi:outer membrane protein OmpA-like peptidoglycan-associated protein
MRMRALSAGIIVLLALVPMLAVAETASPANDAARAQIFGAADEARARADTVNAEALSPRRYADAMKRYTNAVQRYEEGGKPDKIANDLAEAARLFDVAAGLAPKTNEALSRAVIARTDAIAARAPNHSEEAWKNIEQQFAKAAARVEDGNTGRAADDSAKLEAAYRAIELDAIKKAHLGRAREALEQAKEAGAEKTAPKTFAKAQSLLVQADKSLDGNRYDTDPARQAADSAEHEARHAIYITRETKRTGAKDLETLILSWEQPLIEMAKALDVPIEFDNGPEGARRTLAAQVRTLADENARMAAELEQHRAKVDTLEGEVSRLNTEVGGELAERTRELERQRRASERLAEVERMFTIDEAQVLRRENQVIIRLTGLGFEQGSATIRPAHYPLLQKLQRAIALFPLPRIAIEGHTDSVGSAEQNLDLSRRRADAVMAWILANMPLSPANIQSSGYGEARPIASNETREGRTQNRRIDIVIDDRS